MSMATKIKPAVASMNAKIVWVIVLAVAKPRVRMEEPLSKNASDQGVVPSAQNMQAKPMVVNNSQVGTMSSRLMGA